MSDSALPHTELGLDAKSTVDVFLSYNSRDREAVLKIQKMLSERGISSFLDCQHLTVGLNWRNEIEAALTKVNSVVVFISAEGFGRVQRGEKDLALDRQEFATKAGNKFPVIPILLPSAKPDDVTGFLSLNTWVDLRTGLENAAAMDAIAHAINGQAPSLQTPQPELLCPYRGLLAFTEDDAPLFYGRDAFADDLLQKARSLKLIAVVGPSGTGKSSVVQAGLLPRLRRERAPNAQWEAIIFRPGNRPFHNLASELVALYETNPSKTEQMLAANKLGEALAKNELPLDVPINEALKVTKWANRLLFIVDQFEELFTLTEEKDRKPFVNLLLKAAEATPITIVLTLRADFYSQSISVSRELSDAIQQGIVNIGYVKREELRRAIVKPAESVGLQFEDGLIERILDNLEDEPGNLPLLEFALTELWEKRQANRVTNQLYESIGGVEGSISKRAEEVFTSLSHPQQDFAIRAFTRLVRVSAASEEGTDTRQRVKLKDFNDATQSVIQSFVKARLLVTSRNEATGEEIVEVAHEALIKNWGRLKELVSKDREFLLWRQEFNFLRAKWLRTQKETGNQRDGLLSPSDLTKAKRWLKTNEEDLNEEEKLFIRKSEEAAKRPKQWVAGTGTVLLLTLLGMWGWKAWDDRPASQISKILIDSKFVILTASHDNRNAWLKNLVITGRVSEALMAAKNIDDNYTRAQELIVVADMLAQAGQEEVALTVAHEALMAVMNIEDNYTRAQELAVIAHTLAQAGQKEVAKKVAQEALIAAKNIKDTFYLTQIAEALTQAGQVIEALTVVKSIDDRPTRIQELATIAQMLALAGQGAEATSIARTIDDVSIRQKTILTIKLSLAQSDQAVSTNSNITLGPSNTPEDYKISQAYSGIAQSLAKLRDYRSARDIAMNCSKSDDKLHAYAAILREYAIDKEKISPKLFEQLDRENIRLQR